MARQARRASHQHPAGRHPIHTHGEQLLQGVRYIIQNHDHFFHD
jgi:hypothetical protein